MWPSPLRKSSADSTSCLDILDLSCPCNSSLLMPCSRGQADIILYTTSYFGLLKALDEEPRLSEGEKKLEVYSKSRAHLLRKIKGKKGFISPLNARLPKATTLPIMPELILGLVGILICLMEPSHG